MVQFESIVELFEEICRTVPPTTLAFVGCGEVTEAKRQPSLTYESLNKLSSSLAAKIHLKSLRSDDKAPIAIFCNERINSIVAMVAILKLGRGFVPLSPDYPKQKTLAILKDIGNTSLVLTDTATNKLLISSYGFKCHNFANSAVVTNAPVTFKSAAIYPETLAYIIYTSGSTGQPKGVMVSHFSLLNFLRWFQDEFPLARGSKVWSAFLNTAFDASIGETWTGLLAGGTIMEVPNSLRYSPEEFADWLGASSVSVAFLPTAFAEMLLRLPNLNSMKDLTYMFVGGEAMTTYPHPSTPFKVINSYGPTETTIQACFLELTEYTPCGTNYAPPIGKPIVGAEIHLLDPLTLKAVEDGKTGEMFVGGACLSQGYWNRPVLNAERFVLFKRIEYHGEEQEYVLYRTGDMACILPDGNLLFQGRTDDQVKVRGHRFELGEVNVVLQSNPFVEKAITLHLTGGEASSDHLVSFVVPSENSSLKGTLDNTEMMLDSVYKEMGESRKDFGDPDRFCGWTSSFTGKPLTHEEMEEWVNETANTILDLQPNQLLEIGAGSGLIMEKVGKYVQHYTGTDLAPHALNELRWKAKNLLQLEEPQRVDFICRPADVFDFSKETCSYDTVVINSVAQYFPDGNYLTRVLEGAARVCKPGGKIFVGDLRCKSWLEYFHTEIWVDRGITEEKLLRKLVQKSVQDEEELAVDPKFFSNFLATHKDQFSFSSVRFSLKQATTQNELTRYRYNVTMTLSSTEDKAEWGQKNVPLNICEMEWNGADAKNVEQELHLRFHGDDFDAVLIHGIINRRLGRPSEAIEKGNLGGCEQWRSEDPSKFLEVSKKLQFPCELVMDMEDYTLFQVIFYKNEMAKSAGLKHLMMTSTLCPQGQWTNWPSKVTRKSEVVAHLSEWVPSQLPSYMVPTHYRVLDELPMTPNGKVDKEKLRSLWLQEEEDHFLCTEKLHPGTVEKMTTAETEVASVWSRCLSIPQQSIHRQSNFFHIGGNSLLCANIVNLLRSKVKISVADVFRYPVLKEFAGLIEEKENQSQLSHRVPVTNGQIPLNSSQQQIFLHLKCAEETDTHQLYNEVIGLSFPQGVDLLTLQVCLSQLIRKQPMLRARFMESHSNLASPLPQIQFHPGDTETCKLLSKIEIIPNNFEYLENLGRLPFDMEAGPLVKFFGVIEDEVVSKLYVVFHHLIMDGYSLSEVLLPQLSNSYGAIKINGEEDDESGDMETTLLEQHALIEGNYSFDSANNFWKEYFEGWTPLEWEGDFPRTQTISYKGKSFSVELDSLLSFQLSEFSFNSGVTLYTTLLAAFKLLLHRYTGSSDLTICGISPGRSTKESESVIGNFAKLFPIRTRNIEEEWDFSRMLEEVKSSLNSAYQHQFQPFQQIVKASGASTSKMSRIVFSMDPFTTSQCPRSWEIFQPDLDLGISKFEFLLRAQQTKNSIVLHYQFKTNIYSYSTIQRFSTHFQTLLQNIAKQGGLNVMCKSIEDIQILTSEEHEKLLYSWNSTDYPFPCEKPLIKSFYDTVSQYPHKIALKDASSTLTYLELYKKSQQLSSCLTTKHNVRFGDKVAILLPRSVSYVVSVLATLHAGGVYVPLNEDYSQTRINFILEDTRATCLISLKETLRSKKLTSPIPTVLLNPIEPVEISNYPYNPPCQRSLHKDELACVIYTSGSTGHPKGVMLTQRGIQSFCSWVVSFTPVVPSDKSTMIVSPAFDVCIFEMFPFLFGGAEIHVAPEEARVDPAALIQWLEVTQITTTYLPTALAELALKQPFQQLQRLSLKKLFTAGEKLTIFPPANLPFDLVNCYAPTEATVQTTAKILKAQDSLISITPAIGSPTFNAKVYVLDKKMAPLPIGVPGELWIGGEGVALGYLNQPELTKLKFQLNPFTKDGTKIYRTGDFVRWLPNGEIEFKCRLDDQVKIRGHRVELGEVEYHLGVCEGVEAAVVTLSPAKRLVGHLVPKVKSCVKESLKGEVIEMLKSKLPSYMIPSRWTINPLGFQMTPNGKIDRKELNKSEGWVSFQEGNGEVTVKTRSEVEIKVAHIWSSLLEVPEEVFKATDDFFDVGGHSLLVVRLIHELTEEFNLQPIPLSFALRDCTLKGMESLVKKFQLKDKITMEFNSTHEQVVVLHEPNVPCGRTLFLVHAVGGTVMAYKPFVKALTVSKGFGDSLRILGIQDASLGNPQGNLVQFECLEDMASRYIKFVREDCPQGDVLLGGHSFGGLLALEMAKQMGSSLIAGVILLDPPEYPVMDSASLDQLVSTEHGKKLEEYRKSGLPQAEFWTTLSSSRFRLALNYRLPIDMIGFQDKILIIKATQSTKHSWSGTKASQNGGTRVVYAEGDHFRILESPHVVQVADAASHFLGSL